MKVGEAYPSRFIKAEDLNGQDIAVKISSVELEAVDKDGKEKKLVLGFTGKSKHLVCNKTNANTITKILNTDETDEWIGRSIIIGPREVEFQGETVWSIRVSLRLPTAKPAAPAKVAPVAPVAPVDDAYDAQPKAPEEDSAPF